MGCLTGNIAYLGGLQCNLSSVGNIVANIAKYGGLQCDVELISRLQAKAERRESLEVRCGVICEINGSAVIKFEFDKLVWDSVDDNQIGNTKYNTLVASGDWILEEIEELL